MRLRHLKTTPRLCALAALIGVSGCWYEKFEKVPGGDDDGGGGTGGDAPETGGAGGDSNGSGGTPPGAVSATDDAGETTQGEQLLLDVLANDEGSGLSVVASSQTDPKRPSSLDAEIFSISASGILTFKPAADFWGVYLAQYTIKDEEGEESTGEIRIRVTPQNIKLETVLAGWGGFVIDGAAGDFLGGYVSDLGDLNKDTISALEDVNGDDVDDFVVGAPGSSATAAGRAAVIFGGTNPENLDLGSAGIESTVQFFVGDGGLDRKQLGLSVSRVGDQNADGLGDLVVGATGTGQNGRAYVLYGASTMPTTAIPVSDTLAAPVGVTLIGTGSERTGLAVAGGRSIAGQTQHDVLVYSGLGNNVAYDVLNPVTGNLIGQEDFFYQGEDGTNLIYPHLAVVGDLFGDDGRPEVLLASSRITLLRGQPAGTPWPTTAVLSSTSEGWTSTSSSVATGKSVCAAGEFDGTAGLDVAFCDGAQSCRLVPWQPENEFSLDEGWNITGFPAASKPRVSGDGDVNGDGFSDLGFATDTQAYVVLGLETLPTTPLTITSPGDHGYAITPPNATAINRIAIVGDVNDDGIDDYAVSVPGENSSAGRVYVIFGI